MELKTSLPHPVIDIYWTYQFNALKFIEICQKTCSTPNDNSFNTV